jgi:hypothetical protein
MIKSAFLGLLDEPQEVTRLHYLEELIELFGSYCPIGVERSNLQSWDGSIGQYAGYCLHQP